MDPAKPIRITVVNGNVTLSGVVDTQADKDVANIKANGVPGVFKVINNLEVAAIGCSGNRMVYRGYGQRLPVAGPILITMEA